MVNIMAIRYQVIQVTSFEQNCTLLWCEETMRGAVVDPGGNIPRILDAVKAHGLAENTMFTGHIADEKLLNGLYQASTLFVFPSIYDTCGLVVREAAAMGTPAVVVEGSGAAEQIIDRENGFVCRDNDQSLHDSMVYALDHPDIAKHVGMAARKTLCISWDSIIDSVINRYANLIKKTD